MIRLLEILAVLCALAGALLIGNMIYGLQTDQFSNGTGMAILFFQMYGAIGAGLGLLLGLIAWVVGKKKSVKLCFIGKCALFLSIVTLLGMGAMMVLDK